MSKTRVPTVLVAPLNWGLGHSARCVPIVQALERMGAKVLLASDGSSLELLKAEFPHLPALRLPSYHIRYQTDSMIWNIARQIPRMVVAIRKEQWATENLVRQYGIDGIISDNRYGCFSRKVKSVVLTHQIHLRVPNAALQWLANAVLRKALLKFDSIWIPDVETEPSLAGELSHPPLKNFDTQYVGLLSRMRKFALDKPSNANPTVAVVLSGPEPQRTYLEQALLEQALALPQKFVFVQGKTRSKEHHFVAENIEMVSYLSASEMFDLLQSSTVVICRSGYSSLMDLSVFAGKKAILIPTPGQTEQEYLAASLARQNFFCAQAQRNIDLGKALQAVEDTTGFPENHYERGENLETVLETWLESLRQRI